jgi:hypothetical protein
MTSRPLDFKRPVALALLGLGFAAMLAACGGGSSDRGFVDNSGVTKAATFDINALIPFMLSLQANTNETSEPILLGDAVLVSSETAEPTALP